MNKMSREEKLFRNENLVLVQYQQMIEKENSHDDTKEALRKLTGRYKSLLDQTRFLTWISGRLERKLQRKNRELHDNNNMLQHTLDELTKAESGKSAYAIIYFIAIALFVFEELLVEPFLVKGVDSSIGYGILFKLVIVLLLKISEGFIEKVMMRKRHKEIQARNKS